MNFPDFQALADELNRQAGRIVVDPDNPTYEGQQLVNKWLETNKKTPQNPEGYDVPEGGNTDKYLKAPTEQPPADTQATPQTEANTTEETVAPVTDLPKEETSTQPTKSQNRLSAVQNIPGSILAGWTPIVASSMLNTVDPSGLSAGARSQAALYDQAAAENAKIMQWNKQRSTDNTLADKIAAAQAHEKWQQNANSMGAEGAAGTVAGMATTTTPDIMAEKNFQQQAMNTASQNLAEVNKNKLNAEALKTNANVNDWKTKYNQAMDAEAANLSQATGAKSNTKDTKQEAPLKQKNDQEEKPATPAESTPAESTPAESTTSAAPSNQQSEGVQSATEQTTEQREINDIVEKANQIVAGFKSGEITGNSNTVYAQFDELRNQYEALKDKVPNAPEFPKMETPSSLSTSEDDTQKNIVNTISNLR